MMRSIVSGGRLPLTDVEQHVGPVQGGGNGGALPGSPHTVTLCPTKGSVAPTVAGGTAGCGLPASGPRDAVWVGGPLPLAFAPPQATSRRRVPAEHRISSVYKSEGDAE